MLQKARALGPQVAFFRTQPQAREWTLRLQTAAASKAPRSGNARWLGTAAGGRLGQVLSRRPRQGRRDTSVAEVSETREAAAHVGGSPAEGVLRLPAVILITQNPFFPESHFLVCCYLSGRPGSALSGP